MEVVIVIRTEVPDRDEAAELYETIKRQLVNVPDLKISGHSSNHFPEVQSPS